LNDTELQEVRDIVTDLQAEIRRHRVALGASEVIAPPDPLLQVREKQVVNPHLPIGWPVMPRGLPARLAAYAQKIVRRLLRWYINPLVAQQNEYNLAATDLLASLQGATEEMRQRVEANGMSLAQAVQAQTAQLALLQQRHEEALETLRLRVQRVENRSRVGSSAPVPAQPAAQADIIDYFLLGAQYRNRVQMTERLHDYDDVWTARAQTLSSSPLAALPVLDLGCGRGELVAHLQKLGLRAYGIDTDADALRIGQEEGLDLRQADAMAHLQSLADNSLAGVVMIQVIEHFTPAQLAHLFRLIEQKLAPGGLLLAETLNPACVYALTNWYLMDPSHQAPLHSSLVRFLLEQAGLYRVEVRFMHPVPAAERLQPVGGDDPTAQAAVWRDNIERLNHILYGPQDYAALAYKPEF